MSNPYFDFKQFRICHDRCAMKVGTDAVLLGAWARVEGCRRLLDVGCGSGVIALMVAQRVPDAEVYGVDIDTSAVEQAQQNAEASPFAGRAHFELYDVKNYRADDAFDAILCNPPFYTEDTLPPDAQRATARNNHSLPFDELIASVCRLLRWGGCFHVVLPSCAEPSFTDACLHHSLYLKRLCRVRTTIKKAPKRVLCTYMLRGVQVEESSSCEASSLACPSALTNAEYSIDFEELVLMENGERSNAYIRLTSDFYLR